MFGFISRHLAYEPFVTFVSFLFSTQRVFFTKMVSEPRLLRCLWVILVVLFTGISQIAGKNNEQVGGSSEEAQREVREIYNRLNFVLVDLLENSSPLNDKIVTQDGQESREHEADASAVAGSKSVETLAVPLAHTLWSWFLVAIGLGTSWVLWKGYILVKEGQREFSLATQRVGSKPAHRLDMYTLRHKSGIVKMWSADIQESVFRDLEVRVIDLAHMNRILWGLFDDKDVMGKTILNKLVHVISEHRHGYGLQVHGHGVAGDHIVDVEALWQAIKQTL